MTTRVQKQIDRLITHRASEWLETMKSGDGSQNEAFIRWIGESPRHLEEFLAAVALDRELPALDFGSRFDIGALRADATPAAVTGLDESRTPAATAAHRTSRRGWFFGIAAALAIAAVSALLVRNDLPPRQHYETAAGEQRTVELMDGSQLYINAQSTVRVHFDGDSRDIELSRGEALFKVAHDSARPFRVHTPDAVVQALGTEFNVYARPSGTTVAVLEGKVSVSSGRASVAPAALNAGQTLQVDKAGSLKPQPIADAAQAIAWRDRRLIFDRTPLEEVVREFNRYNRSMQLRLEGIPPGSRHYSGDFDADDPQSLGAFLSREPDLAVDHRDGQIVIRAR